MLRLAPTLGLVLAWLLTAAPLRADDAANFQQLDQLFTRQYEAGKYREAEQTALAMRRLAEGPLRQSPLWLAMTSHELGLVCRAQGRHADAERFLKEAVAIRERELGADHVYFAVSLGSLGELYVAQGRYAEAEPILKRAAAVFEKGLGAEHPYVAKSLLRLGHLYCIQGRYAEAEQLHKQVVATLEKVSGPNHPDVAVALTTLADVYSAQARFADEQPLLRRALNILETTRGADHPDVMLPLNALAQSYYAQSRYAEAESLYRRILAIAVKAYGPEHCDVAVAMGGLGLTYRDRGRYLEAETFYKRSLAISEKVLGRDHSEVAISLVNLAGLYSRQGRYAEAEPLFRRAADVFEKTLGKDHHHFALALDGLAAIYREQERYAEAELLHKRALAILQKTLGPNHPDVAAALFHMSQVYDGWKRYDEAESLKKQALAILEKSLGADHPAVGQTLGSLAELYHARGRLDEAESLVDRAIAILDRGSASPGLRANTYMLRARIGWQRDRRNEALADLRQAMQLAEEQRVEASGSAHERAETFGRYNRAFEQMVAWQLELHDTSEALAAMERGRARSLLDEMTQAGADLDAGRGAAETAALRNREMQIKGQAAQLQKQLDAVEADRSKSPAEKTAMQRELQAGLADARKALYEHDRDVRGSNPVFRQLLSANGVPPRLSQIQRRLAADGGLLLVYLLGTEGGYVLALTADKAELSALGVDPTAAKVLAVEPGPLTAKRLAAIAANKDGTGVVQQLRKAKEAVAAQDKLAALWQTLIPKPCREMLTAGKLKRLMIVPDGALALLPFEALVVRPGASPVYLLDAGPPVLYGPSATVLLNLIDRTSPAAPAGREPVLTVGNPSYGAPPGESPPPEQLATRSIYGAVGGKLTPLPHSGWESQWVADVFGGQGIKALRLEGTQATKANVKAQMEGRRVIHLACHGIADQSYGNFFGALAFAPGERPDDPADDGFLTLAEIYQLDLKRCELAILSACETNFGPQQQGEGVWAISRGFLVAGSRRVVASNWLVDDEAAASLVSYFCSGVAQAEKSGGAVNYAEALHNAKRWVRRQEKWQSPFFWGTFVLVGPK